MGARQRARDVVVAVTGKGRRTRSASSDVSSGEVAFAHWWRHVSTSDRSVAWMAGANATSSGDNSDGGKPELVREHRASEVRARRAPAASAIGDLAPVSLYLPLSTYIL